MPLFCSRCGAENSSAARTCTTCGASIGHAATTDDATSGGRGWGKKFRTFNVVAAIACAIYLINPTFGVFELIPDNMPVIGNLDEAAATAGLLMALTNLGLNPFSRSRDEQEVEGE